MDIASQYADVYTDFHGLASLRAQAGNNEQETLRKVAGQFEAFFIQMMLKSMRDANLGEGLMDSDQVKTYQSMFDQQIALDLSKRNGLGLAEMMVRQLSRDTGDASASAPVGDEAQAMPVDKGGFEHIKRLRTIAKQPLMPGDIAGHAGVKETRPDWSPDSPDAFVQQLLPHAKRAAGELGTRPELLIAQAALETGWGKHMIRGKDGANSFNLFGIKADARWKGERAVTDTVEYRDGLMRRERATFRAYGSLAQSFSDYVEFLKANPRYRKALDQAADAPAFVRALSEAGYATDPEYHDKIKQIMDSPRLRDAVLEQTDQPSYTSG